ncbi:NADH-quinone oxidoreductase subunit N [Rhodothermus bifroesti]|uniref:NADH-quinone oxidoreductase subunit N n=1 Tax=Rhodothermus bifroesti TaxID=2823335 RepID=UPI001AEF42DE|nr:NADH-quinone oxidoreductase subunit N [Rhodothermus bifroesti]
MELLEAYRMLPADLMAALPLVLTTVIGLVLVVWDAFRNDAPPIPWVAAAALALGFFWELGSISRPPETAFYGLIRVGGMASFANAVILASGLLTIVLSVPYLRRLRHLHGEIYALILFATVGMLVLASANNLISIFVGLETMSICLYIMTGLVREDVGAGEAALKYFLLGAFSTGFFLYGIALLYGATGTMYLPQMTAKLAEGVHPVMFWAGVALLLVGFLFKVGAVPFHMWTPDVYQGAPTTLTGYMAAASKAAAFAALMLVLDAALPAERWQLMLALVALVTMVAGNVLALVQQNAKRMLAYSSIAHAGYILVGLAAGTPEGYGGALFYLLVYALMNIGAFGVMAFLEWDGKVGREQTMDSLAGIGYRRPLLGVAMAFFMFSLTGFPPLAGFIAKYAVFAPAIKAGLTWLVVVGVLASVLSAYYYLRLVYIFWMKTPDEAPEVVRQQTFPVPPASQAVLLVCVVLIVLLGVLPGLLEVTASFFPTPAAPPAATTMLLP